MYAALRPARSEFVSIRQLRYHVLQWGNAEASLTPLFMLHGWMDVAASFQFVVDALPEAFLRQRRIIAPDWRGFGLTEKPARTDHFWFADYLADLDFLIDHYAPRGAVDLTGHSMGGNIAMLYAGVRPQRVRRLVNLEGFGLPATHPAKAARRYAAWMDELKALQRGEVKLKSYPGLADVARRLIKTNARLTQDKALWLAQQWSQPVPQPDGSTLWQIRGDAAHKIRSPMLYRLDEVQEIMRCITAPVLAVQSSHDSLGLWFKGQYTLAEYHERLKAVARHTIASVEGAGHMLHHDQPAQVAALMARFLE